MVQLYEDERIDYLVTDETLRIIQSSTVFSYSLDAVLLANFARIPLKKGNILDLCSGNGAIPLLLSRRTNATIKGLEIQERLVGMANRSVKLNELEDTLSFIHGDLKVRHKELQQSYFDTVTCNPPYFKTLTKTEQNKNDYLTIARHEVCCTLEDVISACKLYVKPGGKVSMVHRPNRLVDILTLFRKYNIEPKRLQFVFPKEGEEANILLVEGIRDGNPGLTTLSPLYIYEQDDRYTQAANKIIYGQ